MGNHTAAQAQATTARRGGTKGASGGTSKPTPKLKPAAPKAKPGPAPDAMKAARDAEGMAGWRQIISEMRNPANYPQPNPNTPPAALVGAASQAQRDALRETARTLTASRRWSGERAVVIGAQGQTLTKVARGISKTNAQRLYEEVNLPHSDWATIRQDAAPAYLHTHPFGSFSRGDVMSFAEHALSSLHATGPGPDGRVWMYSLFTGRHPGSTNGRLTPSVARRIGLSHAYTTLDRQVWRENTAAIRAGRMTEREADATHAHTVMQRLAQQMGPDYFIYEAGPLG